MRDGDHAPGLTLAPRRLPDVLGLAVAIDAASLIDLALVAAIAASTIRVRAVTAWLGRRTAPRQPRARTARARRVRPPANDEEEPPALAA